MGGKAFFFKGDSYVRYDIASDQVDAATRSRSPISGPGWEPPGSGKT